MESRKLSNQKYQTWLQEGARKDWITIFTPTFNRCNLIHRIYDGLVAQTCHQFVWIVVNDGSSDDTDRVVQSMVNQNEIPILYINQPNGGKHIALEAAINETVSEFFFDMDDDDIYSPEAVNTFLAEWSIIRNEGKYDSIGAIRTLTREEDRIVANKSFDESLYGTRVDQTTLESNYIKHEGFENCTCYRTEALKDVDLFPKGYWMHDQHKHLTEGIWQGRFARKYKCRYYFVVLREYRHDTETSILRGDKSRQHYVNMFINTKMILDEQLDYNLKSPITLFKDIAIVSILRRKLRIPLSELLKNTKSGFLKASYVACTPFSYLFRKPVIRQ
jgi:glycosyltransferase involved in cell wall biosynthesis